MNNSHMDEINRNTLKSTTKLLCVNECTHSVCNATLLFLTRQLDKMDINHSELQTIFVIYDVGCSRDLSNSHRSVE